MSAEVQVAVVNEALKLSDMFRQNAAMRHGIPRVQGAERITSLDTPEASTATTTTEHIESAVTEAISTPSPSGAVAAADAVSRSLLSRAAPFLLAAAVPGAGALGFGLSALFNQSPAAVEQVQPKDGDLLQYLQSRGHHLPEGWQ